MLKATIVLNDERTPDLLKHYQCSYCGSYFEESYTRGTFELMPSSRVEAR